MKGDSCKGASANVCESPPELAWNDIADAFGRKGIVLMDDTDMGTALVRF